MSLEFPTVTCDDNDNGFYDDNDDDADDDFKNMILVS